MGLAAPAAGEPGGPVGAYSNTDYLLLGQLLEQVTGTTAEDRITRDVIERAGLRNTGFPTGPVIEGPHPRMYEAFYGKIDPPRDYSVYDMSWVTTGAGLVSTVEDLNRFYAQLLGGEIVSRSSLAEMQRAVPVRRYGEEIDYGLGLHRFEIPGCDTAWGSDGTVGGGPDDVPDQRRRHAADLGRDEPRAVERAGPVGDAAAPPRRRRAGDALPAGDVPGRERLRFRALTRVPDEETSPWAPCRRSTSRWCPHDTYRT
jgi:CubicO group peptidase (beta-lactamase class C family)